MCWMYSTKRLNTVSSNGGSWMLYLPPRGVRVSLQKLDKLSRLKAERRLAYRCWCAVVVPHCHHLGTWKHNPMFSLTRCEQVTTIRRANAKQKRKTRSNFDCALLAVVHCIGIQAHKGRTDSPLKTCPLTNAAV